MIFDLNLLNYYLPQVTYNDDPGVYLIDCSYMNAVIEDENTPDKSMADIMEEK